MELVQRAFVHDVVDRPGSDGSEVTICLAALLLLMERVIRRRRRRGEDALVAEKNISFVDR